MKPSRTTLAAIAASQLTALGLAVALALCFYAGRLLGPALWAVI